MSYVGVGSCPQCGAPLYSPSLWMSITPPPTYRTCACGSNNAPLTYTAPGTMPPLYVTNGTGEAYTLIASKELEQLRTEHAQLKARVEELEEGLRGRE